MLLSDPAARLPAGPRPSTGGSSATPSARSRRTAAHRAWSASPPSARSRFPRATANTRCATASAATHASRSRYSGRVQTRMSPVAPVYRERQHRGIQLLCQNAGLSADRELVKQAAGADLRDHILERGLLRFGERQLRGNLGHIGLHQVGLRRGQLRLLAAYGVGGGG